MNAQDIRDNYANFEQARRDGWHPFPIYQWGPYEYVLIDKIKLQDGLQIVEVIDVTDVPNLGRFALEWPEQSGWSDEARQKGRRHALVYFAENGGVGVMGEDGQDIIVRTAQLPIHVIPSTRKDAQDLHRRQMDELEAQVDAGGPIMSFP